LAWVEYTKEAIVCQGNFWGKILSLLAGLFSVNSGDFGVEAERGDFNNWSRLVRRFGGSPGYYLYANFGNTLRGLGRVEEAVSALKKGVKILPDSLVSHTGLVTTYCMMGREKRNSL
jgi:hypothetical protein